MIKEGARLFFGPLPTDALRRRRLGAILFCFLWFACIVAGTHVNFLFLSVQALTLWHTTVSLVAGVVGPMAAGRIAETGGAAFPFGLSRLSVVIRFGACIFLVFACLTTLVETVHKASHHHASHATIPCVMAAVHFVLAALFCAHVEATDRILGRRVTVDPHGVARDEASLCGVAMKATEAAGGSVGSSSTMMPLFSPNHPSGAARGGSLWCRLWALFGVFGVPTTALVTYTLAALTGHSRIDALAAVITAAILLREGLRQGSHMLWMLLNNPVRDVTALSALESALLAVKRVPGVLCVHSTNMWRISACDVMIIIRVRLLANADPSAVSRGVRQQLETIASIVYVECASPTEPFASPHVVHDVVNEHAHTHSHAHDHGCDHDHFPQSSNRQHRLSYPPTAQSHEAPTTSFRPSALNSPTPAVSAATAGGPNAPANPYSRATLMPTTTTAATTTERLASDVSRAPLPPPPSFTFVAGATCGNPYMAAKASHHTPQGATPSRSPYQQTSSTASLPPNVFTPWRPPQPSQ